MSLSASIFDWAATLDPRIWQAVVAGGFVATGWLVNGWQNRRSALAFRAEQRRDLHRAIFAEIATNLSNLWDEATLDKNAQATLHKMRTDPAFVPFIPRPARDRIFRTFESSIHILPSVTIDRIVRYYFLLDSIDAIVEDMRGERFLTLEPERRADIVEDYFGMQRTALFFGRLANSLIAAYEAEGTEAAQKIEREMLAEDAAKRDLAEQSFSMPDADRSDL